MGNSIGYRGNPTLYGLRARQIARQEADRAAALKALEAAAGAEAHAALVLPVGRRVKASPKNEQEN